MGGKWLIVHWSCTGCHRDRTLSCAYGVGHIYCAYLLVDIKVCSPSLLMIHVRSYGYCCTPGTKGMPCCLRNLATRCLDTPNIFAISLSLMPRVANRATWSRVVKLVGCSAMPRGSPSNDLLGW